MAQSQQEYWNDVREIRKQIELACDVSEFQPKNANGKCDNTVYIRSLRNRDRNTTAGDIVLAFVPLAAQRIASGTHEVCPDEAIVFFLEKHAQRRAEFILAAQKEKTSFVVNLTEALASQQHQHRINQEAQVAASVPHIPQQSGSKK